MASKRDIRIKLPLLLSSIFIVVLTTACVTKIAPTPEPKPTAVPVSSTLPTPSAVPSAVAVAPTPTATVAPAVSEEEDCMAGCHIPDPNENIAAGAMPQPASHIGRATCLVCHAASDKPPLPATHIGRLDPSCKVCHVEAGK